MSIRPVKRIVQSQPTMEGAGVRLRRAFAIGALATGTAAAVAAGRRDDAVAVLECAGARGNHAGPVVQPRGHFDVLAVADADLDGEELGGEGGGALRLPLPTAAAGGAGALGWRLTRRVSASMSC